MSNLKKEEAPVDWSQVAPYGVFQILNGQKEVVDYGVGVIHQEDQLVTFGKYLKQHRTIGKIFFKKLAEDQGFPLSFDLGQKDDTSLIVLLNNDDTQKLGDDGKFVNVFLNSEFERVPRFLSSQSIRTIDSGRKGYAIGLDKSKGTNILLHNDKFELDSHIMDLRLKYKEAILFVSKQDKEYCYGFYEDSGNDDQGNDLYLSNEFLQPPQAQNEGFIQKHDVKKVEDPAQRVPFKSIGILRFANSRGTAQLLSNKDGCKYLITCAHNFIGGDTDRFGKIVGKYNHMSILDSYTFELPRLINQFKPLRKNGQHNMVKVENFKIKKVYIPEKYQNYFKKQAATEEDYKFISFPLSSGTTPVLIKMFYDIAIIELQEQIKELTHGFVIEEEEKPIHFPVEVSGFPEGFFRGKFFGIDQGDMYTESTASHQNDPSYVQLSNNSDGDILMMHKLSTLAGNSGSPIYSRISRNECRLIAIHTTGAGLIEVKRITSQTTQKDLLGTHNYGTYIHSKNIKSWLHSVLNQ